MGMPFLVMFPNSAVEGKWEYDNVLTAAPYVVESFNGMTLIMAVLLLMQIYGATRGSAVGVLTYNEGLPSPYLDLFGKVFRFYLATSIVPLEVSSFYDIVKVEETREHLEIAWDYKQIMLCARCAAPIYFTMTSAML